MSSGCQCHLSSLYIGLYRVSPTRDERRELIRTFILEHAPTNPDTVAAMARRRFGVTRQAINKHMQSLIEDGILVAEGHTNARSYRVAVTQLFDQWFPIADLHEDQVWDKYAKPILGDLPPNVVDICVYGFTEMLNNAIDHSEADKVNVQITRDPKQVQIRIIDFGVGVFAKIHRGLALESARQAVFELTKGKVTTAPDKHTGEGIFFTSRMFDRFSILSGTLFLQHTREGDDWLIEDEKETDAPIRGTHVTFDINPASDHTVDEVYGKYSTSQPDYAFNRTRVVVSLSGTEGERLVSRSQAKRVLSRLTKFKEVALDFTGVENIGPSFADEIFRVFQNNHPDMNLQVYNANEGVARMIARARAVEASREGEPSE
jgi:hypothetical protein